MIGTVYWHSLKPEVVVGVPKEVFTGFVILETTNVAEIICIPVLVSRELKGLPRAGAYIS